MQQRHPSCHVIHGVYERHVSLVSMTITEMRLRLRNVMNLDPEAASVVNGIHTSDDHVLGPGDVLTFIKPAGRKRANLPINSILHGEFTKVASTWPDERIPFALTSPPYDSLREYHGYQFDYQAMATTLHRIMTPGGVVVWVVADQVVKGGETGNSFRHALAFQETGFLIHDTMIYEKNTSSFPARQDGTRYTQVFEYMFVFSKGTPNSAKLICDKENRWQGGVNWGRNTNRGKDGILVQDSDIKPVPQFSPRNNIWRYVVGGGFGQSDKSAYQHPATFPETLARDHILSWSNPGDVVLDPLAGSGTTCVMAKRLGRHFIGVDISQKYCDLAEERVRRADPAAYSEKCRQLEEKRLEMVRRRKELLAKLSPIQRKLLGFPSNV